MKMDIILKSLIVYITLIFTFNVMAGSNYLFQFYNKESYPITITPVHSFCVYAFSTQPFTVPAHHEMLPIELRTDNAV